MIINISITIEDPTPENVTAACESASRRFGATAALLSANPGALDTLDRALTGGLPLRSYDPNGKCVGLLSAVSSEAIRPAALEVE